MKNPLDRGLTICLVLAKPIMMKKKLAKKDFLIIAVFIICSIFLISYERQWVEKESLQQQRPITTEEVGKLLSSEHLPLTNTKP